MEAKLLIAVFALGAVFAVTDAIKCYECTRLEWTIFSGGEDEDKCEYVNKTQPPIADGCMACAFDTRDEGFDWVGRHCIKEEGKCKNGTFEQETPGLEWINKIPFVKDNPDFDTQRTCCTTDLCNNIDFDTDSASSLHFTSSLIIVIALSLFFNFRQ